MKILLSYANSILFRYIESVPVCFRLKKNILCSVMTTGIDLKVYRYRIQVLYSVHAPPDKIYDGSCQCVSLSEVAEVRKLFSHRNCSDRLGMNIL